MKTTDRFSKNDEALVAAIRDARRSLSHIEKLMGFESSPDWVPLSFASKADLGPGTIGTIIAHPTSTVRGKALVVHGMASLFAFIDIRVGTTSQLSTGAPFGRMPCEQFAYDNPPRLINFDLCHASQDFSMTVMNLATVALPFAATVWVEPLRT